MTEKELIESMAHKNGSDVVHIKTREELAELQLAFARIDFADVMGHLPSSSKIYELNENLIEEIVDVEIMIMQIKYFLKQGLYEQKRQEKLEHIKQLLDADV